MPALPCVVSALAAGPSPARGGWAWRGMGWSWDRLQIATWGMPHDGRGYNATEIAFKERFRVIFVDNMLNRHGLTPEAGCIVGSPEVCSNASTAPRCNTLEECTAYKSSIAKPLKDRARADQKVLGYRGVVIAWWNYVTPERGGWWLRDPITGSVREGVIDWRVKDAADYYVDKVIGESTWGDPALDGVFVDSGFGIAGSAPNFTLSERQELQAAELEAFRRIAVNMAAHGKVIVVSLKSHFRNITADNSNGESKLCPKGMAKTNRTPCWPFGEEEYFRVLGPTRGWVPFRQYNIPSRDFGDKAHGGNTTVGCASAIEDLKYEGQYGPSFATNNDGAPDGGHLQGQHNVSLAAYLLAAQPGSYFSSGHSWGDDAPQGYATGNMVWWPEYDRKLGPPNGDYTREGWVFRRSFQHLNVELDCSKVETLNGKAAKLEWLDQ